MEDERELDEAMLGRPGVHNCADDLGLVARPAAVWKHRKLLDRLKWR
jgi:hypothetical protein